MPDENRKLHDYEVTLIAAHAMVTRPSVRKFFTEPDKMRASMRFRIEKALRELGLPTAAGQ